MPSSINVPVKRHDGYNWAELSHFGSDHIICGERFTKQDESYGFVGGHRVRLYKVKKNVHWRIPVGSQILDIADVTAAPPRRLPSH